MLGHAATSVSAQVFVVQVYVYWATFAREDNF